MTNAAVPIRRDFLTDWHGALNVMQIAATHGALVGWFVVAWRVLPWWLYLPASVLACVIHQRAMSEWIHEGAHLCVVRQRRWNDLLTNVLAAPWFVTTVDNFRGAHLPHHTRTEFFVPEDSDTGMFLVTTRRDFWLAVARDLCGLSALATYRRIRQRERQPQSETAKVFAVVVVQALAAAMLWQLGRLDIWIIYYGTLGTFYTLMNRVRTYGQHVAIDPQGFGRCAGSGVSRTTDGTFLDRLVFTSPRLLFHFEHHRYPHLPYRALRSMCLPSEDVNRYTRNRWSVMRALYAGLT